MKWTRRRLSILSEPISDPEAKVLLPFPDTVTHRVMHPWPRSQVPEIDGSQGAFIGVVVALSVLIVVCCGAVFYLLRHHEPTEQDRAARRAARYQRSATRRGQTLAFAMGSSSAGSAEDGGGASGALGSLSDKVKQAWQMSTGRRGQFGRGGRGWMRAGSNDEWGPHSDREDDDDDDRDRDVAAAAGSRQIGSHMSPLPTLDSREPLRPHDGPPVVSTPGSEEGTGEGSRGDSAVRIIESPSSDTASGFVPVVRHAAYGTAFMDSPFQSKTATMSMSMSHVGLPRPQSPLSPSSPAGSSPRGSGGSVDDESHEVYGVFRGDDRRHHSTMSNASVWTQAGSKFIEDI